MIIQEIYFYFRKYKIESFLQYTLFTIVFLVISSFVFFLDILNYNSTGMKEIYEEKAIYHLIDGYYEGDEFRQFLKEEDSLNYLKSFYNELAENQNFMYLTHMDQHIGIQGDFFIDSMLYGYNIGDEYPQECINEKYYTPIKSMQMNAATFEFFKLKVNKGKIWNKQSFKDKGDKIPVILGNAYQNIYKVGDLITINYYFEKKNVEVIGFLEKNSKVFYNGDVEFYLDDYVLIPYINYEKPINKSMSSFQEKVYFAMVNGYLVTDDKIEKIQQMMDEVSYIADKCHFKNYSFIGYNAHYNKLLGLIKIIKQCENLIKQTLALLCFLVFWLSYFIFYLQNKNYQEYYNVHFILGTPKKILMKIKIIQITAILILAYITTIGIMKFGFKIGSDVGNITTLFIAIVIGIILNYLSISQWKKYFGILKGIK